MVCCIVPLALGQAAQVSADFTGLLNYSQTAGPAPLKVLDDAIVEAGKDPSRQAALVAAFAKILAQPSSSFATRQAVCERLPRILGGLAGNEARATDPVFTLLASWLENPRLYSLALLALEPVRGELVDRLLQTAAERVKSPLREILLASLERRHRTQLVSPEVLPSLAVLSERLGGSDMAKKEQALAQLPLLPAQELAVALSAILPSLDADTQYAVIVLLGRLGKPEAGPAVLQASAHADASVRLAALQTLGKLPGTRESAQRLLELGSGKINEESKAALNALSMLSGPGITEFLLAGAREGPTATRIACLRSLSSRNALEALPLLYQLRQDALLPIRLAALDVLNEIAPFTEQAALLDWTLQATDNQESARAQRALITVTQRAPQLPTGVLSLIAGLEKAQPAAQARTVAMLARLGDEASLACVVRLAKASSIELCSAAISALGKWPDPQAIAPLSKLAASSSTVRLRSEAASAVLGFLNQKHGFLSAETSAALPVLFDAITEPALQKTFLLQLGRSADEKSARFAEALAKDPNLTVEARLAADNIKANLRWPPVFSASSDTEHLKNLTDKKPESTWVVPATLGQWLLIDFKAVRPLRRLILDYWTKEWNYPEVFEVFISDEADKPGALVVKGVGSTGETIIELPPGTRARYVRIVHSAERVQGNWAICEFQVE